MKGNLRTPKNYDGIKPTNKSLKCLAPAVLQEIQTIYDGPSQTIIAAWDVVVGPQFALMTKATAFDEGVLTVKVKNSSLLSLLHQSKVSLLQSLRSKFPYITISEIHFRIG